MGSELLCLLAGYLIAVLTRGIDIKIAHTYKNLSEPTPEVETNAIGYKIPVEDDEQTDASELAYKIQEAMEVLIDDERK